VTEAKGGLSGDNDRLRSKCISVLTRCRQEADHETMRVLRVGTGKGPREMKSMGVRNSRIGCVNCAGGGRGADITRGQQRRWSRACEGVSGLNASRGGIHS